MSEEILKLRQDIEREDNDTVGAVIFRRLLSRRSRCRLVVDGVLATEVDGFRRLHRAGRHKREYVGQIYCRAMISNQSEYIGEIVRGYLKMSY